MVRTTEIYRDPTTISQNQWTIRQNEVWDEIVNELEKNYGSLFENDDNFKQKPVDKLQSSNILNDNVKEKMLVKYKTEIEELKAENHDLKKKLTDLQEKYDRDINKKIKVLPDRFKNLEMEN